MEQRAIEQAIETLRGAGEPISARRIRRLLVAEHGQGPSYRDIYQVLRETGAGSVGEASAALDGVETAEDVDPDDPPDEDEADEDEAADELPPAAVAALQQAQQQVQALDAEQPARAQAIATAREAVLQAVSRQLALLDARKRGLLPAVVGELADGPLPPDEACLAIEEAVRAAGQDFRQARMAATQTRRALAAARQHVLACQQALAEARREAQIRERCPQLWRRRQAAIAARDRDPLLVVSTNCVHGFERFILQSV